MLSPPPFEFICSAGTHVTGQFSNEFCARGKKVRARRDRGRTATIRPVKYLWMMAPLANSLPRKTFAPALFVRTNRRSNESDSGTNRLSALIECVGRCQGISGPVTNTAELALRPHADERPRKTPTASIMAAFPAIWPLGHMNGLKVSAVRFRASSAMSILQLARSTDSLTRPGGRPFSTHG